MASASGRGETASIEKAYVCPACHGHLSVPAPNNLTCLDCGRSYPVRRGIPDFVRSDLGFPPPSKRSAGGFSLLSHVYETRLWYEMFLQIFGGLEAPHLKEIRRLVRQFLHLDGGTILDAGSGPGTLSRFLAAPERTVYAVDASMSMLRRGLAMSRREGRTLNFSRALLQVLPFPEGFFQAAILGGTLHLFRDPTEPLSEIRRTLRPGSPLVVTTFVAGRSGLFARRSFRRLFRARGFQVFDLPRLEKTIQELGFIDFDPLVRGSFLIFRARKSDR